MPSHDHNANPTPLLKLARVNWIYVALISLLAGVGYTALYSAGGGAPFPFAQPQAVRFCLGLAIMLATALVPPRFLRNMAIPTYVLSIALLLLVLKMGHVGKGAERWVNILGIQFQPSEFAKIALVLMLSNWFSSPDRTWRESKTIPRLLIAAVIIAVPFVLILKEPNLGTAVIVGVLGVSMCFAAGLSWWVLGGGAVIAIAGAKFIYAHLHAYQKARITTFLHPEHDPLGAGYNIIQSKIALGSGGVWGRGYLHGTQGQLNFLPEKQTDFIFTMIGEEWGFVGALSVLILLAMLIFGGMYIATRPHLRFCKFLALGVAMDFFMYVAVNLSMVTGVIPVGGVPLPLVSYGGSALLTMMFGFGLLMSCWVHRFQEEKKLIMFFDLNNLIGFMGAIAVMTVTPGLAAALVLQAASKGGFKSALATTWGVAGALAIWGIVASVGLGTFLVHYPLAFLWIRRLGSLYLAFIGLRILYASFIGKQREQVLKEDESISTKSLFAYARDSFVVMVLTPEIGVFDATFFPQFMTKGQDFFLTGLLYTVIEVILALIWQTFLGGLGSSWKLWQHPRFQVYADRVFGVILLLLAARGWK